MGILFRLLVFTRNAIPFLGFDIVGIITIMIIVNAGSSCAVPGVFANHADLAPNFAGKLIEQMPLFNLNSKNPEEIRVEFKKVLAPTLLQTFL